MGMKTRSEYLWSRRSLLLVCFVVAAILTFQAIRIWIADYRGYSNRIDQMEFYFQKVESNIADVV